MRTTKQIFRPADWPRLWASYTHANEKCRFEYDRRTSRDFLRARQWNERVLLNVYRYHLAAAAHLGQEMPRQPVDQACETWENGGGPKERSERSPALTRPSPNREEG